jgi:hypothetical protein
MKKLSTPHTAIALQVINAEGVLGLFAGSVFDCAALNANKSG